MGKTRAILSGYSYHLPSTYTRGEARRLNSNAWGGGMGRAVEVAERQHAHGVFLRVRRLTPDGAVQPGLFVVNLPGERDAAAGGPGLDGVYRAAASTSRAAGRYRPRCRLPPAALPKANVIATVYPDAQRRREPRRARLLHHGHGRPAAVADQRTYSSSGGGREHALCMEDRAVVQRVGRRGRPRRVTPGPAGESRA